MLCYDGVFGKCFEAEESDIRETVEQLNSKLKQNGYLFLYEYWNMIKKLIDYDGDIEPRPQLLYGLRFKELEDDVFQIRVGMLDDIPVLVIQPI